MITNAAISLARRLCSGQPDERQQLLCQYGIELWLYTIASTAGLLLLGLLFNAAIESVIIISVYYICQSNGGGFHASTHAKCFLTMVFGLLTGLFLLRLPAILIAFPFVGLISGFLLLCFPLCLHQNKSYLNIQTRSLIRRSRCITICLLGSLAIARLWNVKLFSAGCTAVFLSSVSRVSAVYKSRVIQS